MTSLETTVRKLITALTEEQCFGDDGSPAKKEKIHEILDLPFLHVFLIDLSTHTFCYANKRVAERVNVEAGWLPDELIYTIGLLFDPMSFQRILSELDRFSQGALPSNTGILTLLSLDDPDEQTYCNDLSALVGRSKDGKNTYHAHFFCELEDMDLVNAYASFDLDALTGRQLEALSYLLKGHTYKEIAEIMDISYKTLEKHVHTVYSVTGCQNQAALISTCNNA